MPRFIHLKGGDRTLVVANPSYEIGPDGKRKLVSEGLTVNFYGGCYDLSEDNPRREEIYAAFFRNPDIVEVGKPKDEEPTPDIELDRPRIAGPGVSGVVPTGPATIVAKGRGGQRRAVRE